MFKYFLFLAFFILFFVASIRKDVGIDYIQYSNYQIPDALLGNKKIVELFYYYLIRITYPLMGIQGVFMFTHLIIMYLLYLSVQKNSKNFFLSTLILIISGFFNHSLNIMRQSIAIAFFLWSLNDIFEGKFLKYLIKIAVATLFHKTAIIMLPLYLLRNIKFTTFRFLTIMSLAIFSGKYLTDFLVYITIKLNMYRNYINIYREPEELSGSYLIINTIVMIFIFFCYFNNKKISLQNKHSMRICKHYPALF